MPIDGHPTSGRDNSDVLALCADPRSVHQLQGELATHNVHLDCVTSIDEARTAFFARGGHSVLVLAPDVPRGLAERTTRALRGLDPRISCVAFGQDLTRASLPEPMTRLPALHPNSRAGAGAVMRIAFGLN